VLFSSRLGAQELQEEPLYRLWQGSGYPVCTAFLENLNAFPRDEPPMGCEQKIHPSHPEFTRPVWEDMDVNTNLPLIYDAERLLWRFTPIGTDAKPFAEWRNVYQRRIQSGEATPRLRRWATTLAGSEETLIWYEPVADECEQDLEKSGFTGGPGGYLFVLSAESGELQTFGGLIGIAQNRMDVFLYHGQYLYFTNSTSTSFEQTTDGFPVQPQKPVWLIGLHALDSRLSSRDRYAIQQRCYYYDDRTDVSPPASPTN
jgi:hypothetical protein